MLRRLSLCALLWTLGLCVSVASAQPFPGGPIPAPGPFPAPAPAAPVPGAFPAPWGRCDDMVRSQSFAIENNLHTYQYGFPANQGWAARDPSGMTFLRMPAVNPMADAFFVTWNLDLVQISTYLPNPQVIGRCFFQSVPARPAPPVFNAAITPNHGVIYAPSPNGFIPVPQMVVNQSFGLSPPGIATAEMAQECMDESDTKAQFADCMIPKMMSPAQRKAYACAKRHKGDKVLLSSCLAQTVVGQNEQRYIQQATACYQQYGADYNKYPLCMASQNFDPKAAATVECMSKQAQNGQVSAWTVAGCAAGSYFNMNAESTVALQCAMSTGGQPYAFAACTGGQLTANELTKCFTVGVGGNGCFGNGNTIVQGLRAVGIDLQNITNPNGAVVNAWNTAINDIQNGPGANNDVIKAVDTINNDLRNGLGKNNDIRKAAENIGLGGLF